MSEHEPEGTSGTGGPPARISAATVVGGAILGFIASWVVLGFLLVQTNRGSSAWWGLLGVVVLFLALVVPRRSRQAGAGVVLGLSVGMLVGSGICAAVVGDATTFIG